MCCKNCSPLHICYIIAVLPAQSCDCNRISRLDCMLLALYPISFYATAIPTTDKLPFNRTPPRPRSKHPRQTPTLHGNLPRQTLDKARGKIPERALVTSSSCYGAFEIVWLLLTNQDRPSGWTLLTIGQPPGVNRQKTPVTNSPVQG